MAGLLNLVRTDDVPHAGVDAFGRSFGHFLKSRALIGARMKKGTGTSVPVPVRRAQATALQVNLHSFQAGAARLVDGEADLFADTAHVGARRHDIG